jgi:hypothetical protein
MARSNEIKDLVKERKQIQLNTINLFKGKFRTVLSSELRSETILKIIWSERNRILQIDALYVYQNL